VACGCARLYIQHPWRGRGRRRRLGGIRLGFSWKVFGVCQSSTWRGRKQAWVVRSRHARQFVCVLCGWERAAHAEFNHPAPRRWHAAHHMPPSFASPLLATNGDWRMDPTVIVVFEKESLQVLIFVVFQHVFRSLRTRDTRSLKLDARPEANIALTTCEARVCWRQVCC
jgi:hypothetical protein